MTWDPAAGAESADHGVSVSYFVELIPHSRCTGAGKAQGRKRLIRHLIAAKGLAWAGVSITSGLKCNDGITSAAPETLAATGNSQQRV